MQKNDRIFVVQPLSVHLDMRLAEPKEVVVLNAATMGKAWRRLQLGRI